jgi:protein phosphatase
MSFPTLRYHIESDVGRVRANNEDSYASAWLADGSLFVVVADGMGGHEAGEVASGLAVQVIEEVMSREPERDPRARIFEALIEANRAIREEGRRSKVRGMGTTSVVALCAEDRVYVGLVGDSRCYHVRRGRQIWRTSDHTRVQDLIDSGTIGAEDARVHPEAGMLTRALGHERMADGRPLEPDVIAEPLVLEPDDAIILCSDGLHDLMEDWELGGLVAGKTPAEAARALVEVARDRGGHDNITVAVVVAGAACAAPDPDEEPDEHTAASLDEDTEREIAAAAREAGASWEDEGEPRAPSPPSSSRPKWLLPVMVLLFLSVLVVVVIAIAGVVGFYLV